MPRRTDIEKILIIGAGPIVIGQACEFDYSGSQACKALKEDGFTVILLNSNPATIMTDPAMADRTYVEPVTVDILEKIIEAERPDAILPTLGGQTALNTALEAAKMGILDKYGVELIGAKEHAIQKAEDREEFKEAMERIGIDLPRSGYAHSLAEAQHIIESIGFPAILRPSFTLGGMGGNIAYNRQEFDKYVEWGIEQSPVNEILIEESIIGWKEYELEVMRDTADNVVIICSIENFDAMGVHTGDSITVAPAQTLTDKEYQLMRDASLAIIREIGVDTGGSNIQFGVNPDDGRLVVIEMNPRVSRSSALASKATGFPIAKIAAQLAVGYTLDEITNDITGETPASFEPTIDYVVTKIPRFDFEKFAGANATLTTQMKSVGEVMGIGRTFKESLQKAISSMEKGYPGLISMVARDGLTENKLDFIKEKMVVPNCERLYYIADALREGFTTADIYSLTGIDPWFLDNINQLVAFEGEITGYRSSDEDLPTELLRKAKEWGFSDIRLAQLLGVSEAKVAKRRRDEGVIPVFKLVDTCGAEFEAKTPYLYSTYESECEAAPTDKKKVIILGGGPNRIGQGIEFDYCCVHGVQALSEDGFETIMVNCNPETVSTDYDTSDRLYFEPLTFEHVMNIVEKEKPWGVIVQFGGQTPLKLTTALEAAGVPIIGTSPDAIDLAEDRERFQQLLHKLNLLQPENALARSVEEAVAAAMKIGYPLVVRPSYVLGGRAMEIVYDEKSLRSYMANAVQVSPEHPVLLDRFLNDAIEVDVDAICDGKEVVIGGIMEHIEEAGVHSGDSACSLPPYSLTEEITDEIRRQTVALAHGIGVKGLMNIQFAVQGETIYVLEVNPRASRTVPFVSKATGVPLAKMAARVMAGKTLAELGFTKEIVPPYVSVKEAVFPFIKFPGVDTILSPEMRSTGEVMGIDNDFGIAFLKSQIAAGNILPTNGTVFISVKDEDKDAAVLLAKRLDEVGMKLMATHGTAKRLRVAGLEVKEVKKIKDGRPHVVDAIVNGEADLLFNTILGTKAQDDSYHIRRAALEYQVPYFTTIAGAKAAVSAIRSARKSTITVTPLQEYYG
ncbi:MAG: carbamoyl phosphate synthase large subunit [Deltaproteobacteria bacterium]|nr:MAG: carbamoyl phosphate synthase large subunit [Deltaproteobacteria bacterium]